MPPSSFQLYCSLQQSNKLHNTMFFNPVDAIAQKLIRPQRSQYTIQQLGASWFKYDQKFYDRKDYQIPFIREKSPDQSSQQKSLNIVASLIYEKSSKINEKICVTYLHGNIGSRISVIPEMQVFLKMGLSILFFDFIGCGLSDGEYLTLGHEEKHQIKSVISYTKNKFQINQYILYGRSMGAASALYYCEEYNCANIIGLLLDSPYSDMDELITYLSNNKLKFIPNFILSPLIEKVSNQFTKRTGYSLFDLKLSKFTTKIPVFVFYARGDEIISESQVMNSLDCIQTKKKKLKILEGEGHNTIRQQKQRIQAFQWLLDNMDAKIK